MLQIDEDERESYIVNPPSLQVPFPMGVNVRSRPGKNRTSNIDENLQEGSLNLPNGDICCNGDETPGSVKED